MNATFNVTKLSDKKFEDSVSKGKKFNKHESKNNLLQRSGFIQRRPDSSLKKMIEVQPIRMNTNEWSLEDKMSVFMQVFGKKILEIHAFLNDTDTVKQIKLDIENSNKKKMLKYKTKMKKKEFKCLKI